MNILYLHGMGSKLNCPKVKHLRELGHNVSNPKIVYERKADFDNLLSKIRSGPFIDMIIGSSMGGYFAYELGKHFDIPVLLLNPALHSRTLEPKVDTSGNADPLVFLGVGEYDNVINYEKTLEILDDEAGCFFRSNYWRGDHAHRTPIDFFDKVFNNTLKRLTQINEGQKLFV